MRDFLTHPLVFSVIVMLVVFSIINGAVAYCILLERKISAWMQDRVGPNRVGPKGLLQPIADGIKFFLKEDIITGAVDRPIFLLAPAIAFVVAVIGFAVIPWAGRVELNGRMLDVQVANPDIGLLYILAIGSLGVYGMVLGGWASNNKFSFYGGIRATAQMLSYEIPMGLSILVVVLTTGTLKLDGMVARQMGCYPGPAPVEDLAAMPYAWTLLLHPVAFILMLITAFAETNRLPFDLAEAEQELIGGYQTEYSGMKMALFYLGEYAHMITLSAFISVMFLGGWELFPFSHALGWGWLDWYNQSTSFLAMLLRFGVLMGKVAFFIFVYMWVRWTIPRFRFDQLMRLAWRGMVPLGMGMLVLAGLLVYFGRPVSIWAPLGNVVVVGIAMLVMSLSREPITARQADLPPLEIQGGPHGRGAVEAS